MSDWRTHFSPEYLAEMDEASEILTAYREMSQDMSMVICRTGQEATITEAIAYLERRYRVPAADIRSISVLGEVNEPIQITVTLFQRDETDLSEREISVLGEQERVFLRSDGTYRTEPWHTLADTDAHADGSGS
jgi:hypothetical protein